MSYTIGAVKSNLIGMGHSGTLNRVRNFEAMCERAANTMLQKVRPLETERKAELAQAIYDRIYSYALPTDFAALIDLYPEDNRTSLDEVSRIYAETFNRRKGIDRNKISIESKEGIKYANIDWPTTTPMVLNTMESLTVNGTWSAVGSAANLKVDTARKITGLASIEFDVVTSGDGIKNTTQAALNLSSVDNGGGFFAYVYFPAVSNLTSVSAKWGNDLTLKYWTSAAQTAQFDGNAFAIGWNLVFFPWVSATETGVVDDTQIDSFQITIASTGAIANVRVDNITVGLGRYFYLKYYSKFLFKDTSGNWEAQPRTDDDDDTVIVDSDTYQIFLMELLIAMAHQVEGSESDFDINFAEKALYGDPQSPSTKGRLGLYRLYTSEQPDQRKKATDSFYAEGGNVSRGRW